MVVDWLLGVVVGGCVVCRMVGMLSEKVLVGLIVLDGLSAFLKGAKVFYFAAICFSHRRFHAKSVLG